MGQTISVENGNVRDKLQYINHSQDSFFGSVDIYHLTQPPYEYLMDYRKIFINDRHRLQKQMAMLNKIRSIDHPNLAKIYHCEIKEHVEVCIKDQILHCFVNYYNFNLKQAISKKKYTKHIFSEGDLLYIIKSLVSCAIQLQKHNISKGNYRSDQVFLSPEGHVKIYLLNIDPNNKHNCYYTVLSQRQKLAEYLLAPEQLATLNQLDQKNNIDFFKADVFAIALLIVQLLTLDHAKFYYDYDNYTFMWEKVQFILNNYANSGYSTAFIAIIKKMLEPDPKKRINFEQLYVQLNQVSLQLKQRTVYCIRLEADMKVPTQKTDTSEPPKRRMLQTITSKLTPKPIELLSSTKVNRPLTSTRTSFKRFDNNES